MSKHFPLDNDPINPHHGRNRDDSGCIPKHVGSGTAATSISVALGHQWELRATCQN